MSSKPSLENRLDEHDRNAVHIEEDWPGGGSVWFGRNEHRDGFQFYLGLSTANDSHSIRIPEKDRKRVAALLRRFARRLDP